MGLFDIWKPGATPPPKPEPSARLLPAPKASQPEKKENPFSIWKPKPVAPAMPPSEPRPGAGIFEVFAPGPEKPKTFSQAIVPEVERGSLFETAHEKEAFDVWRESAPHEAPSREAPQPGPSARRTRPSMAPWLDRIFNFDTFWDSVREARQTRKFQAELARAMDPNLGDIGMAEVFEFAAPKDEEKELQVAWMLGIDPDELERAYQEGMANQLIGLELEKVAEAMNEIAPRDLTGRFEFGDFDDGGFGLIYFEDPLRRLR